MVETLRGEFPVAAVCRALELSKSGYYAWRNRRKGGPSPREREDIELRREVRVAFAESRKTYGRPRLARVLKERNCRIGANRLRRLMREEGIVAKPRRRFKTTTDSKHDNPIAPNLVAQNFSVAAPDRVWCADMTYVRTIEGWLYLAVIVDLFSRKVVGYAIADHMRTELCLSALEKALGRRSPGAGLVHHSDRGSQYASQAYQDMLRAHGCVASMSRAGCCYDNAVVESFNDKIKQELLDRGPLKSGRETRAAIVDYIEMFYNPHRLHSTLGYESPNNFERKYAAHALAV